jgi:hypothetical protein
MGNFSGGVMKMVEISWGKSSGEVPRVLGEDFFVIWH